MIESIIIEIALALFVCMLLGSIFTKYKQSSVIGYLLGGVLLGPHVFKVISSSETISLFSELGVLLLLFYIGLELDVKKFKVGGLVAFVLGPAKMAVCFGLGFLASAALGFTTFEAILIGLTISMSSTAIIGKHLIDNGLTDSLEMKIAIPMLLIEDFVAVVALALLSTYGAVGSINIIVLNSLFFIIVAVFVIGGFSRYLMKLIQRFAYERHITLYALGFALALAFLADYFSLSPAIGAFLAGFLLSGLEHADKIRHELETFRDFFVAFFFIAIGLSFVPTSMSVLFVGTIILVMYVVGELIAYGLIGSLVGLKPDFSIYLANLMIPIGEFSLIIAGLAINLGVPHSADIVNLSIFLVITSTFITPYCIRGSGAMNCFFRRILPAKLREGFSSFSIKTRAIMGTVFTNKAAQSDLIKHIKKIGIGIFAMLGIGYLLAFAMLKTETQLIAGVSNLLVFLIIGIALALPSAFIVFREIHRLTVDLVAASRIPTPTTEIEVGFSNIIESFLILIAAIVFLVAAHFHGAILIVPVALVVSGFGLLAYGILKTRSGLRSVKIAEARKKLLKHGRLV